MAGSSQTVRGSQWKRQADCQREFQKNKTVDYHRCQPEGVCAQVQDSVTQCLWSEQEACHSINCLELKTIRLAVLHFQSQTACPGLNIQYDLESSCQQVGRNSFKITNEKDFSPFQLGRGPSSFTKGGTSSRDGQCDSIVTG